ncbi:hypothetical protein BDM02DRAFT_3003105 [Thelephora ganbajun]|uniref:Uncharacterized protein n=1 Tax=Thelephora ganbajun TaxID=370292 RepID=A0ACB6ZAC7_THEGA|nr:hypothetical protein BDM02DRAFT_3003105 [Thelephora ganbajun]
MLWLKKSKKSRQLPQPLASLEIPTHIAVGSLGLSTDMHLGISSEAANDGQSSRVAFRDRSGDRRLHVSGSSTQTHGCEDAVTRGYILLQLIRPMSVILIVLREREHEREILSNAPNQQPSYDAPSLSSAERQSEAQNRVEREDRGTVTKQSLEAPPERISKDDHTGEDVDDTVQSGSRGECRCSDGILGWINSYQFQREAIEARHLGPRPLE